MDTTYTTGPLNENYGYDPDLVAPLEDVMEVARLSGDELWEALEGLCWEERDELDDGAVVVDAVSSPDGQTLVVRRVGEG